MPHPVANIVQQYRRYFSHTLHYNAGNEKYMKGKHIGLLENWYYIIARHSFLCFLINFSSLLKLFEIWDGIFRYYKINFDFCFTFAVVTV